VLGFMAKVRARVRARFKVRVRIRVKEWERILLRLIQQTQLFFKMYSG
jgi:hypothetical protein